MAAPVVNTSNGLGIFPPIKNILQDLYNKVNIIYTGIATFNLNNVHDIQSFTSSLTNVRQQITKEIAGLTIHTTQATNTMNAAIAAKAQNTVMRIINFIKQIVAEIQSAIQCIALVTKIIVILVAIPILILAKIAELIIHAIMMAEQAVVAYLKSLLHDLIAYINAIKQKMLAYVQQQQAISMIDGLLTEMKKAYAALNAIMAAGTQQTQKTAYNTNVQTYNADLAILKEINEDGMFGSFNVEAEIISFFGSNLLDNPRYLNTI